ncbi:hypothetical protein BDV96DRAFT_689521, partial [Lophiotrema nucula]
GYFRDWALRPAPSSTNDACCISGPHPDTFTLNECCARGRANRRRWGRCPAEVGASVGAGCCISLLSILKGDRTVHCCHSLVAVVPPSAFRRATAQILQNGAQIHLLHRIRARRFRSCNTNTKRAAKTY